MKKTQSIQCDICGAANARERKISRTYGKGSSLLVIENISVLSCPKCGESYFLPETLRAIERIKRNRKQLARPRPISVARMPSVNV